MIEWKNLDEPYRDRLESVRARSANDILGVAAECSKSEARLAYLRLVKTYHPDAADPFMASYNQEMLKMINQAYKELTGRRSRT